MRRTLSNRTHPASCSEGENVPLTRGPRLLGLLVLLLLATAPSAALATPSTPPARAGTSPGYRCVVDTFAQSSTGRITFRRLVNNRVAVSRTSTAAVGWHPLSWGLLSVSSRPGHETTRQLVPSSDGRVRLVETAWQGGSGLRVTVLRVVASDLPHRMVAAAGSAGVVWLDADGVLHRRAWNGTGLGRTRVLPITIKRATAITEYESPQGHVRAYVATRTGALHVVTFDGTPADLVLAARGFSTVTGLKAGPCLSPDYVWTRAYSALLRVDRNTGVARFARHLRPGLANGGELTKPVRVDRADWTWRWFG